MSLKIIWEVSFFLRARSAVTKNSISRRKTISFGGVETWRQRHYWTWLYCAQCPFKWTDILEKGPRLKILYLVVAQSLGLLLILLILKCVKLSKLIKFSSVWRRERLKITHGIHALSFSRFCCKEDFKDALEVNETLKMTAHVHDTFSVAKITFGKMMLLSNLSLWLLHYVR